MPFTLPGTSAKAGGYMKTYLDATAPGAASLFPAMEAMAKGVLQALAEDEAGFNILPGVDGETAVAAAAGNYVQAVNDPMSMTHGLTSVNATSGVISLNGVTFSGTTTVTANALNSVKFQITAITNSNFSWNTSDGSNLNTTISWAAFGG